MSALQNVLQSMRDHLATAATVEKVFGTPVQVGEKTIIPVARLGFGFGAGLAPRDTVGDAPKGSGGGGGIGVQPVGVLEITGERTRFIRFTSRKALFSAVLVGLATGWFLRR